MFRGGRENDAGVGGVTFMSGEGANYMTLAADATFVSDTDPFNPGSMLVVSHYTTGVNLNQAFIHGTYPSNTLVEFANSGGRVVVNANDTDDNICVTTASNNGQFTITNKFDVNCRVTITILRFNGI